MKATVFSYTRLSAFDQCQHRYVERYVRNHVPRHDTIEAFVGKRVHEVVEAVERGILTSNLHDAWRHYLESWTREYHSGIVDVRRSGHDYWRDYGQRCVARYLESARVPDGWELVGVEHKLGAPLLDQPMASFIGVLDRLIRRGDEHVVQDFKTGKKPKAQYFLEDHQLPVYSHLVVHNHGLDPDVRMRCERIYLAHGESHELVVDRALREAAWWWAQHTAIEALVLEEELRLGRRVPTARQQPLCDWCAYKKGERCPVWALSLPAAKGIM